MEREVDDVASAAGTSIADGLTLETARATITELKDDYARLWRSYEQLKEELALIKRRMFIATAERIDTTQLQLEFEELVKKLNALSGEPDAPSEQAEGKTQGEGKTQSGDTPRDRPKPKGRRKLEEAGLPEVPIEVSDPLFEQLVQEGKAERIGFEESSKLAYERGGLRRVVIKRVKYAATTAQGETQIETAAVPAEIIPRCMASASTLALIATSKYCDGLPLFRVEQMFERWGFPLDRGTMSRWLEQLGATLGATVIEAAKRDALATAFCMMTDATGFAVQPGPSDDGVRRPCRKGHYFVMIADRDHIFFEFTPKETSENVRAMFKGFEGYLQADAKSVYDVLFRPPEPGDPDDDGCTRIEVGCWSHARRKYWEAALAKQPVAREALVRIGKLFELDERYRKGNPPSKIKELRQRHLKPLVHEFLAFATAQYETFKNERGSLRSALGYCVRQADALTRFLEDGRLRMDNNLSESALRKVVIIRDSALFAGSDEHAQSAGHILSLIASARLHSIEPQQYLRDLIRVLPYWPRDRFLELAPKFWIATRARIDADQLAKEVGVIDVPPRLGA
jgi:transposase